MRGTGPGAFGVWRERFMDPRQIAQPYAIVSALKLGGGDTAFWIQPENARFLHSYLNI